MLTTIFEIEFFHLMPKPHSSNVHDRRWPTPDDVLCPDAVTPVRALTRSGLLLWLLDGTVVHCDWDAGAGAFARRDATGLIPLTEVLAWAALPRRSDQCVAEINHALASPETSDWLKQALWTARDRDVVDAARDADRLAELFGQRCRAVLNDALVPPKDKDLSISRRPLARS